MLSDKFSPVCLLICYLCVWFHIPTQRLALKWKAGVWKTVQVMFIGWSQWQRLNSVSKREIKRVAASLLIFFPSRQREHLEPQERGLVAKIRFNFPSSFSYSVSFTPDLAAGEWEETEAKEQSSSAHASLSPPYPGYQCGPGGVVKPSENLQASIISPGLPNKTN